MSYLPKYCFCKDVCFFFAYVYLHRVLCIIRYSTLTVISDSKLNSVGSSIMKILYCLCSVFSKISSPIRYLSFIYIISISGTWDRVQLFGVILNIVSFIYLIILSPEQMDFSLPIIFCFYINGYVLFYTIGCSFERLKLP